MSIELWASYLIAALAVVLSVVLIKRQQSQQDKFTAQSVELGKLNSELDAERARSGELSQSLEGEQAKLLEQDTKLEEMRERVHRSETQLGVLNTEKDNLNAAIRQLEQQLLHSQKELDQFRDENKTLSESNSVLKTSQAEKDKHHQEQLQSFEEQKAALGKEFENLANRIFDEKGRAMSLNNKESIEHLLKPFREQITDFKQRVERIHKESNESTGSLKQELEHLKQLNKEMTDDAKSLTQALKGDKKKVGSWGEMQLEKTLQLAGLVKGDHYEAQAHFKDEKGKNNYPDFVVKLPDDKHIVIDSKVSLIDYDDAISATTDAAVADALDRHVKAVKNHIDSLSGKDYTNLIGMKSPSFVLMFMPIEPAYIEAMKQNRELFNYGYQKGVVLVSHTTLMPILRTVANLWMIERSNAEAKEISDRAGEVFNQVCVLADRLKSLGATLLTAGKHYNSAVVGLVGQQGLHGKVERFSKLSNKATKNMPELDVMHMDIEVDRLQAIAVEESDTNKDELVLPASD